MSGLACGRRRSSCTAAFCGADLGPAFEARALADIKEANVWWWRKNLLDALG